MLPTIKPQLIENLKPGKTLFPNPKVLRINLDNYADLNDFRPTDAQNYVLIRRSEFII